MTRAAVLVALSSMTCGLDALAAQACLASPHAQRGWLGVRAAHTSVMRGFFGAEAGVRIGGRVTVRAEADRAPFDAPTPARTRVRTGLVVASRNVSLPVCLSGSVAITTIGELTVLAIPVGIVTGWAIPVAGTATRWSSRLEPRMAYRRASLAGFHSVSAAASVVGGTGLSRGRVYGGFDFEWLPAEARSWAIGLRAAVGF